MPNVALNCKNCRRVSNKMNLFSVWQSTVVASEYRYFVFFLKLQRCWFYFSLNVSFLTPLCSFDFHKPPTIRDATLRHMGQHYSCYRCRPCRVAQKPRSNCTAATKDQSPFRRRCFKPFLLLNASSLNLITIASTSKSRPTTSGAATRYKPPPQWRLSRHPSAAPLLIRPLLVVGCCCGSRDNAPIFTAQLFCCLLLFHDFLLLLLLTKVYIGFTSALVTNNEKI